MIPPQFTTFDQALWMLTPCHGDSGAVARIAGDALGANQYLPNMATDDFLKCLSKTAMERAATALNVLPRQTGKATRAALIEHIGQATYILPAARFTLSPADVARLEAETSERPAYDAAGDDEGEDLDSEGTGDEHLQTEPDAGDDGRAAKPTMLTSLRSHRRSTGPGSTPWPPDALPARSRPGGLPLPMPTRLPWIAICSRHGSPCAEARSLSSKIGSSPTANVLLDTGSVAAADVPFRVTGADAQMSALHAGVGMTTLPCFVGDAGPLLERVPGTELRHHGTLWLLTQGETRKTKRVRLFTEFVAKRLASCTSLLAGQAYQSD